MTRISLDLLFSGEIVSWRGPSPYHFVPLPPDACDEVRGIAPFVSYGWGVIPVACRIGTSDFTTSLFPKDGGYLLPVKDIVRRREGLAPGDVVEVELTVRG